MEDLKTKAAHLNDHVGEYVKTKVELAKAQVVKGASKTIADISFLVTALIFGLFFLAFLFMALAWWLSSLLNSTALGFLCVAGLCLLLILLFFAMRKKIAVMVRNAFISEMYD